MNAKLRFRHELKFTINRQQYFIIRQRLTGLIRHDEHAGHNGEYHIRSLYFDDIDDSALHDKLGGLRDRRKYRIRIYDNRDTLIHFEKKIKNGDFIAKLKEPLTREMYDSILSGNIEVLHVPDKPLLMELYHEMKHRLLAPRVIVDYVREPFVCENGNVRITFDKELRTGLHAVDIFDENLRPIPALDDQSVILEVKYDEYIPEYLRAALQLEGLRQQSASKYVICRKYLKTNSWEDY
ncbi:polyphosphate polymerase domain-containing protein [Paenibacillus senegalimassiliensis]|uniref:polyphosphate polymerase domain-containing protein n=1 Tax=Paenibacillus senegalimassiliensis TaxID=1737426 RepID=UPI00073F72E4|nr:polyphosphate polymerase domain-containing protein [Paenibacillus senegalimassiliensis]